MSNTDLKPNKALQRVNMGSGSIISKPAMDESDNSQGAFEFIVDAHTEKEGIGMGVLSDGTPFLNQRGLARLCGVKNAHIGTISTKWNKEPLTSRVAIIKALLKKQGFKADDAHIEAYERGGKKHFAYPAQICLAVLEYYAFEAGDQCQEEARNNFRLLAGSALRDFIYTQVGYDPDNNLPEKWKIFHDRVSLNSNVPIGYFSVFKEIADIIVALGQRGVHIDSKFVPDISVGKLWAAHWQENDFDAQYGERRKYEHNYPDYFPQAGSNPQYPYCYPEAALGEFRRWIREGYIGEGKMKRYLVNAANQGKISQSFSQLAIRALESE